MAKPRVAGSNHVPGDVMRVGFNVEDPLHDTGSSTSGDNARGAHTQPAPSVCAVDLLMYARDAHRWRLRGGVQY